jgi:predicted permease
MLDPKVWWPLFPLLLLVVVVCLTWATVYVVRKSRETRTVWLQCAALACYVLAAAAAIASEKGLVSANLHRPFSVLTQMAIVVILVVNWRKRDRPLLLLNSFAWGAILADTALHFVMMPK